MGCAVGIDIGSVSAKAAILIERSRLGDRPLAKGFTETSCHRPGWLLLLSEVRRTRGQGTSAAEELLGQIVEWLGAQSVDSVAVTGSGSALAAERLKAVIVNEFKAIALGLSAVNCHAKTVFEMGGETSKYLRISGNNGAAGISDYATNGDCAAGTGSFIDQQAGRLKYATEDLSQIVSAAQRAAQVAGRCSVFAKSDMIHAQQKGYTPAEVLRGLCDAVARNFRSAVVRSHGVELPVAFIGGVAANSAVVGALRESFGLDEQTFLVPEGFAHIGAIGAAAAVAEASAQTQATAVAAKAKSPCASASAAGESHCKGCASNATASLSGAEFPRTEPLRMDNVLLLRDRVEPYRPPVVGGRIDVCLGIDIGSVSTNLVAVDADGRVVHEIYVRTQGRPIEVVREGLDEIRRLWGDRLNIRGVGTTGSGRELIGELVGADTVNDEITAHKTGATFVGRRMLNGRVPDTIFEIGGQDAKFISLHDGIVVDFTMNEACAAGTGSFLEERAEELGIAIKNEFAAAALASPAPVRLGERCTVFMERDVNSYLQRGANKSDLVAGLAYSVVYNYINRVVRGRKIGQCVFFQGGTAYNDAVAAAFAAVTGRQIIVPPHNGVIGAIGSALLAWEKALGTAFGADSAGQGVYVSHADADPSRQPKYASRSRFRGYDLSQVDYTLREFTCKACSNACQVQEFTVEGSKTYWGDKCSDRYRKQAKVARKPVIEDLFALRMKLLLDESALPPLPANAPTVGIPLTMFAWEQLPFWRALLAHCGYRSVLGEATNKRIVQAGLDSVVAEPCFPIIVAHGAVVDLAARGVDYILLPNVLSQETPWMHTESHLCPWHQTMPWVIRQSPAVRPFADKLLIPSVRFRQGRETVLRELRAFFKPLGVSPARVQQAMREAFAARDRFRQALVSAGRQALDTLTRNGTPGIILVGRPYNVHDAGVNLSVATKLRSLYGVNVLPLDALDLDDIDVRDVNDCMYWDLGRRILAAAKLVGQHPNLHIVYITNFKCGPDSYIKHFIRTASGKPFLTLQMDGHSNDAGMMTRCEAYLDSKGILRQWRSEKAPADLQPV